MTRTLLALLLARANSYISTERLVEALWDGRPPASAENALRVHVSHLRKALAQDGPKRDAPIEARHGGYRVCVATAALDALRFEAAVADARDAVDAGAPREAADLLEPALDLWRGPAFADLHHLEALRAEAVRLDELRLTALEVLVDTELELGRAAAACDRLGPAVAEYPLRESLTERLMRALYQSGRASEALRACSRLRAALDRELGVPPGPSIRELENAIVLQSPELDQPRGPVRVRSVAAPEPTAFVGRRAELRVVDDAWQHACRGSAQLVLVAGRPGIGKSAFANEVARRVAKQGAVTTLGACDPDPATGFEPVPQLLRRLVAADVAPLAPSALRSLAPLVADVPGESEATWPTVRSTNTELDRECLASAFTSLFSGCHAPVLVVAEDLQWAGADALALLRHIACERDRRVLVLATYRDSEVGPGTPLDDALGRGRFAHPDVALSLDEFDMAELAALVRSIAPDDVRARLSAGLTELHGLTSGHPWFVSEVVQELTRDPDTADLAAMAPDGVRASVERGLARLGDGARECVRAAAVFGTRFSLHQVSELTQRPEPEVLKTLEELVDAHLVADAADEVDAFVFPYPVVRNAIYRSIPQSRRARLHLGAGEILEARRHQAGETVDAEQAGHFVAALPLGDATRAASCARRAGEAAGARLAFVEAARWYRKAIELADAAAWSAREESTAYLALGEVLERAGSRDDARDAYQRAADRARVAGDPALFADIAIAATPRYVTVDSFHPTQRRLVDEALATIGDDTRRRAWLLSCGSSSRYYDDSEDGPFATQALELARRSTDPEVRAVGLLTYHRWLTHDPHAAADRLALSTQLRALCESRRLDDLVGVACREVLVDLLTTGAHDEFDHELGRLAHLATIHAVPSDRYWVRAFRATRALMHAADDETEGLVHAAATLGRQLEQADAAGVLILQTFALRRQQGRSREILEQLTTPRRVEQPYSPAGLALFATALVEAGRPADARRVLDTLVDDQVRLPHDNMWLAAVGLLGGVAAAVGSGPQRELLAKTLTPFSDQWCVFGAGGAVFGDVGHWLEQLAAVGAVGDDGEPGHRVERPEPAPG